MKNFNGDREGLLSVKEGNEDVSSTVSGREYSLVVSVD